MVKVTASWLKKNINRKNIKVVDASWYVPNIKRNPNRMKRVPRRTAINWVDAMTPQGQALYAAEFVDNASGRHLLYKYQSSRNLQFALEAE